MYMYMYMYTYICIYIYIYIGTYTYLRLRSALDPSRLHIIPGGFSPTLWVHHQQREDSHRAERKKWLRSSRHRLGGHGKLDRPLRYESINETWEWMPIWLIWKNNDAQPMDLGVSPFSNKPRCSTGRKLPSCQPRAAHFSSYSPFSTWKHVFVDIVNLPSQFPSLRKDLSLSDNRVPSMVNHHLVAY